MRVCNFSCKLFFFNLVNYYNGKKRAFSLALRKTSITCLLLYVYFSSCYFIAFSSIKFRFQILNKMHPYKELGIPDMPNFSSGTYSARASHNKLKFFAPCQNIILIPLLHVGVNLFGSMNGVNLWFKEPNSPYYSR